MGLLLEAVEVTGPLTWRWLLSVEETGNPLADHSVRLDSSGQDLSQFSDLYGYERTYAAPDRRIEDGTRFTRLAGEWAGRELLGESVGAAILAEAPVTVKVRVPAAVERVLLWPLELAHADGKPLAAQDDVTFVYDIAPDAPARRKAEVGDALRMLAVFSQPSKTSVLALRRERYALTRLIREIAALRSRRRWRAGAGTRGRHARPGARRQPGAPAPPSQAASEAGRGLGLRVRRRCDRTNPPPPRPDRAGGRT
jgi:hypothetical protein